MKKIGNFLFIFVVLCFSVKCVAQKKMVSLFVSQKEVVAGEEFTYSIRTNMNGQVQIQSPKAMIEVGMSMTSSHINIVNGIRSSEQELSQNVMFTNPGIYVLGPAIINGKKSNTVTITVQKSGNRATTVLATEPKNTSKKIYGIIESTKKKVFVGQAFVVKSKVLSKVNLTDVRDFVLSKSKGALEIIDLTSRTSLKPENVYINGIEHISLEFAHQLCFGNKVGRCSIDPFRATMVTDFFSEPEVITSTSCDIEIISLPINKPKSFTGLVGSFDFESEIINEPKKQGSIFQYVITVSGTGNLHLCSAPKLNLPKGISLYGEPKMEQDIEFGEAGSFGQMRFYYYLQVENNGKIIIPSQMFSYFNPENTKYVSKSVDSHAFLVSVNENAKLDSSLLPFSEKKESTFSKLFLPVSGILSLICLAVIFFLKRKGDSSQNVSEIQDLTKNIGLEKEKEEWVSEEVVGYKRKQEIKPDPLEEMVSPAEFCSKAQTYLLAILSNQNKRELFSMMDAQNVSLGSNRDKIEQLSLQFNEIKYGLQPELSVSKRAMIVQKIEELN